MSDHDDIQTPYQKLGFNELSLFRLNFVGDNTSGDIAWLKRDTGEHEVHFETAYGDNYFFDPSHIVELPKDAEGFYLWDDGECPVPGDWKVQVKLRGYHDGESSNACGASLLRWSHMTSPVSSLADSDIVAFKPVSRPDMPRHSEGDAVRGAGESELNPITAFMPIRLPDIPRHLAGDDQAESPAVAEDERDILRDKAPMEDAIRRVCAEMAEFLVEKNRSYGNSAAKPVRIFAKAASPLLQIDVRIDDKLNRMMQGGEFPGDDTVKDLAGYLLLRMVVAAKGGQQ